MFTHGATELRAFSKCIPRDKSIVVNNFDRSPPKKKPPVEDTTVNIHNSRDINLNSGFFLYESYIFLFIKTTTQRHLEKIPFFFFPSMPYRRINSTKLVVLTGDFDHAPSSLAPPTTPPPWPRLPTASKFGVDWPAGQQRIRHLSAHEGFVRLDGEGERSQG